MHAPWPSLVSSPLLTNRVQLFRARGPAKAENRKHRPGEDDKYAHTYLGLFLPTLITALRTFSSPSLKTHTFFHSLGSPACSSWCHLKRSSSTSAVQSLSSHSGPLFQPKLGTSCAHSCNEQNTHIHSADGRKLSRVHWPPPPACARIHFPLLASWFCAKKLGRPGNSKPGKQ